MSKKSESLLFPCPSLMGTTLHFSGGIPGFSDIYNFRIEHWGGLSSPFFLLTSIDGEEQLEFLVVSPEVFFPDYVVKMGVDMAERLGLQNAEDAHVFVIVTVGENVEDSTVNLMGPLVVNEKNGEAVQIVLSSPVYNVSTYLFQKNENRTEKLG